VLRNAQAKVSVDDRDVADVRREKQQAFPCLKLKALLLRVEKLIVEGAGGWKIIEGANATEGGRYSDLMVREG